MINFEEEIKKFHPSQEIEDAEMAIKEHDLSDMTDVMMEMMRMPVSVEESDEMK